MNLAQPPAVFSAAIVGIAHHGTAGRRDGSQLAVRIIRKRGCSAYAVGNREHLARNRFVIRQRHGVALHVFNRRKVDSRSIAVK